MASISYGVKKIKDLLLHVLIFPVFPPLGETPQEALSEASVALELFIESTEAGDKLPKPTESIDYSGQIRVRMPKTLHSSLARKAKKEGVSLNTWMITLLFWG